MFAFRLYESSKSKKSLYFDLWLNLSHWLGIINAIVRANQYGDSLV